MYERRHHRPISSGAFVLRLPRHFAASAALLAFSLIVGIAGYVSFEHLPFLDGLLNASMLLGGMGPVNAPVTAAGKLFASFYALYAGLFFIVAAALILAPVLHRRLHLFHSDEKD